MNFFKTITLLTLLSTLLVGVGWMLGGPAAAIGAFAVALLMNFVTYFFSDKIVLKMYGAREVTEADAPELYRITRGLAQKMGMPMPKVCIAPSPSPNAFATGRSPSRAAVCATEGILELLAPDELEAVMAHEMGHVKNRDTLTMTVAAAIASAISMLGHFAFFFAGRRDERGGGNPLVGLALMILAPLAAMVIQLAISRSREFGADRVSAHVTRKPRSLIRALEKIHQGARRVPMTEGTPATASLMIAPAFGRDGWMTNLFSTHPTLGRRAEALEALEEELSPGRTLIRRT